MGGEKVQKGHGPSSKFWDPVYISGIAEATNFKFGVQIDYKQYYQKCETGGQKRSGLGHMTYFYIVGPLHVSGTAEATNFKLVMLIDYKMYYQKCTIKIQYVTHYQILAFVVLPSCYLALFRNKGNTKMTAVETKDQFSDLYTLI